VIAAEDAENDDNDATRPSERAAVAGASAAVFSYFYPDEQAFLDAQVSAQRTDPQCSDKAHTDFAAGEVAPSPAADARHGRCINAKQRG
jgi:hypothetical protein